MYNHGIPHILGALFAAFLLQACLDGRNGSSTPVEDGLPAPESLVVAAYDTLAGVATLRWRPVEHPELRGYAVYRGAPEAVEPGLVTPRLLTVTEFVDSIFRDS